MCIPYSTLLGYICRYQTTHLWIACIIITTRGKGISLLQKPEKIYLENTNLSYALEINPDIGSIRESFILNQLINSGHKVFYPKRGDFFVDKYTIEVGGRQKANKQAAGIDEAYVAADDILAGAGNKIPLWLFGFLY